MTAEEAVEPTADGTDETGATRPWHRVLVAVGGALYGGLILAENGAGIQHLVGVTDQGKTYPITRNDLNDSEFTGPGYSADGRILFACIQSPGHVFAITGPWRRPSNADT